MKKYELSIVEVLDLCIKKIYKLNYSRYLVEICYLDSPKSFFATVDITGLSSWFECSGTRTPHIKELFVKRNIASKWNFDRKSRYIKHKSILDYIKERI